MKRAKIIYPVISAILILALLLSSGCALLDTEAPSDSETTPSITETSTNSDSTQTETADHVDSE